MRSREDVLLYTILRKSSIRQSKVSGEYEVRTEFRWDQVVIIDNFTVDLVLNDTISRLDSTASYHRW